MAKALLLLLVCSASAYNNGVARKPALGWNTWCTLSDCHNGDNKYFDRCNEFEVMSIAEAMVSNGMHKVGFDHVNLDGTSRRSYRLLYVSAY